MKDHISPKSTFKTADPALRRKAVTQKIEKLLNLRLQKQSAASA